MAKLITPAEREMRTQRLLDRTSLTREEAEEVVAIALGESEGDVVSTRPLTPEERKRIGLGLTMEEALERMEQRSRELAQRTGD
jgi:hypothetical protein